MPNSISHRFLRGLAVLLLSGLFFIPEAMAITLTGSNGRAVEIAGIKEATPKGITAQVTAESPLIGIAWEKLDLEALKRDNPQIFTAYQKSKNGENTLLNLGSYAPAQTMAGGVDGAPVIETERYAGWVSTTQGEVEFFMKLPKETPRAILLIAAGNEGEALQFAVRDYYGVSPWDDLQRKYQLALLSYEFRREGAYDPTQMDSFGYAEKKSGEQILKAIRDFAAKEKVPGLVDLPIAIHGSERVGAALAYSFLQWKPEQVIAAVIAKGAFYDAMPTEASIKVPALFLAGQYSNNAELWMTENDQEKVFEHELVARSNWTRALEFRGPGMMTPQTEMFGLAYLEEMIGKRLPEKGAVTAATEEEAPEDGAPEDGAPEDGTPEDGAPEDGAEASAEGAEPSLELLPLDRSAGFFGQLKGRETVPVTDPSAAAEEGSTFIPGSSLATMWKAYGDGTMKLPETAPAE